jgi:hypothetical protein
MLASASAVAGSSGDASADLPSTVPSASGQAALRGPDQESKRNDPDLVDRVFQGYDDLHEDLLGDFVLGLMP